MKNLIKIKNINCVIFLILAHLMNKLVSKVSDLKLIPDKDIHIPTQFMKAQE
jgi:hypothetical protein